MSQQAIGGGVALLAAHKVLQMYHRRTASILAQISGGIFARVLDPAHIDFGFEHILGHGGIEEIQRVHAAEGYKFEIVIVIQQLNAVVAAQAAKLINRAQHACEGWRARALLGAQVGHGDIIAADGLMIVDHALHIRLNQLERHMAGYGTQAAFLQHGAHILRAMAVETGKLHAVVAKGLKLTQHGQQILLRFLARRIDLIRDRCVFHAGFLAQSLKYTGLPVLAD